MCGRFAVAIPKKFSTFLGVDLSLITSLQTPRYNVAPNQEIIALTEKDGSITSQAYCWGFPPPDWMKGFDKHVINARADGIETKPMFRDAFRHRRCLVLATGFYEWKKDHGKIPYYFYLPDSPVFCMAGIYSHSSAEEIPGLAIVTTTPNELVSSVHERMPVILPETACLNWIQTNITNETLLSLLKPYSDGHMKTYPVSNRVNSPTYEGVDLIQPREENQSGKTLY